MKNTKNNNRVSLSECSWDAHALDRLSEKFSMTAEKISPFMAYFKIADHQCRYSRIKNQMAKYPSKKFFFNEKLDMFIAVCPSNKAIITAMEISKNSDEYSFNNTRQF